MIKRYNALKKFVCAALCSVIVAAMGTAPSLGAAASAEDGQSSAASSGSLNGENISEKDSNIKKYNNFLFSVNNNSLSLKAYSGSDAKVSVPNAVDGLPVTAIDSSAFAGNKKISEVIIPSNVKTIGTAAFMNCTSLRSVTLSTGIDFIEKQAFYRCSNLLSIKIPNGIKYIGYMALGYYYDNNARSDKKVRDFTIISNTGTASESYAKNNGFVFIPNDQVQKITLNKTSCTLVKGETLTLSAEVTPSYAADKTVVWTSSDSRIASVSAGKVKAIRPGNAVITAKTKNGKTAVCKITVKDIEIAVQSIKISKTAMTLGKGEEYKLWAAAAPSNATNKTIAWRSSDPKILTVDKTGNVKAKGNGTAWITARSNNGKEVSCRITVKNAPSKITIAKGILSIGKGEKYTLGSGVNEGAASAKRIYRSSNSSVIKMTRTEWQCEFTGVKPGVAYITVRSYNGKESTCKVTVKEAPGSVAISKKTLTLKVGQTAELGSTVPADSACSTRIYRTSNSSVVKMINTSWKGSFKAMKPGTAYITVRTYNGKESSCKVTVTK